MEYDIFISYSRKDSEIVDQFVSRLTDAGYNVWIDRDGIYSGDQFKAIIVKAIKSSSLVVFVSSANSNASDWTVKEISYALKKGKTIIPVKLDDAEYDDSIDFDLINIDFIQYQPNQFLSTLDRLIASIEKHLGQNKQTSSTNKSNGNLTPEELFSQGYSYYENQKYDLAVEHFKKAAEYGNADAQNQLGDCYLNGEGVPEDSEEALKWYHMAAEQGNAVAQFNLAKIYYWGLIVPQDYQECLKWLRNAAEQGNAEAQCFLGVTLEQGDMCISKNYYEAEKWYHRAAEQGLADAQNYLGEIYRKGLGVKKNDLEAIKWYRLAAEQGLAEAQSNLGGCFESGRGVPQDYQKAAEWYRKAAEQGLANAQYLLGCCYKFGKGVPQDEQEAVKWFTLAAEQGLLMP